MTSVLSENLSKIDMTEWVIICSFNDSLIAETLKIYTYNLKNSSNKQEKKKLANSEIIFSNYVYVNIICLILVSFLEKIGCFEGSNFLDAELLSMLSKKIKFYFWKTVLN